MTIRYSATILFVIAAAAIAQPADAAQLTIPATILRAIDGDTIEVEAQLWTDTFKRTVIRVRGVDAPEMHGKCEDERQRARAAQAFVAALDTAVILTDIKPDKYGGRYDAGVTLADGRNLAEVLVSAGHARPYHGEKRLPWCDN